MKKSVNKVLIIVLIVIASLAIVGGVFAYTYLATDIMRSEQELFAKYLMQNYEKIVETINLDKVENLKEKLNKNKYEEKISISYTEEGETLATGTTTIDKQKDPIEQKEYGIISLETQKPEETLKLEYMYGEDMYSVRFTNAVLQFLSIKNNNLKELAKKLEIDEEVIEEIPNQINLENLSLENLKITKEEISTELNRYINVLYNNLSKEKYSKTKNTVITVNGKTITTNAYILTLNMQDIKNLSIKLLESLKQDEIILTKLQLIDEKIREYDKEYSEKSLKDSFAELIQEAIDELTASEITEEEKIYITIYEKDGNTVRIKVELGLEYITLDTTEIEGKKQIDINYTNIDSYNTQLTNVINLVKESDGKLIIKLNSVYGEEQNGCEINIKLTENENNAQLNIMLEEENGKTDFSKNINFMEEIEYKVKLDSSNNIVINDLSKEKMEAIVTLVSEKINKEYIEAFKIEHLAPFNIILNASEIGLSNILVKIGLDTIQKADLTKAEIEAINSKFTTYEENELSVEKTNELLTIIFLHNQSEAKNLTERYVLVSGDVEMSSNATTAVKVNGNKTYKVKFKKNEEGLINEILITEKTEDDENAESDISTEN